MLVPLFTETGIMPLQVRRYLVLLNYLRYIWTLEPTHLARACLNSSIELATQGKKSGFGDLCKATSKLPFDCPPLDMENATERNIEVYTKSVESG
jgi:hypothetical protein